MDILEVNEQHFAAEDMRYGILTAETELTLSTRKHADTNKHAERGV